METEHEKHFLVISAPHVQFPWLLTSSKQYNKTKHNVSHPFSSNLTEVDGRHCFKSHRFKRAEEKSSHNIVIFESQPLFRKTLKSLATPSNFTKKKISKQANI